MFFYRIKSVNLYSFAIGSNRLVHFSFNKYGNLINHNLDKSLNQNKCPQPQSNLMYVHTKLTDVIVDKYNSVATMQHQQQQLSDDSWSTTVSSSKRPHLISVATGLNQNQNQNNIFLNRYEFTNRNDNYNNDNVNKIVYNYRPTTRRIKLRSKVKLTSPAANTTNSMLNKSKLKSYQQAMTQTKRHKTHTFRTASRRVNQTNGTTSVNLNNNNYIRAKRLKVVSAQNARKRPVAPNQ